MTLRAAARPGRRPWTSGLVMGLVAALWALAATAQEGSLSGRLLVATPDLTDPNFSRTVVFMVEHNLRGALGLVVNEPMGEVPRGLLLGEGPKTQRDGPKVLVHYGGPVEPRAALMLHSTDILPESSVEVGAGIAFSRDQELLRALGGDGAPRHHLLALGYSGWAPGQLESEIERGSWYVIDWDEDLVFGRDHAGKWDRAIALYAPEL